MINKLLNSMGEDADIDDDLYNGIYDGMLIRLRDTIPVVRVQAVLALARLQNPEDASCPVIAGNLIIRCHLDGGGGHLNGKRGIRLIHGLTKSTLITYFSGMKVDPKYAFLRAFFLICLSCPFQNLSIWPKTHPFFKFYFYTFLHP